MGILNDAHLFTADMNETTALIGLGWEAERTGWHAADELISDTLFYRLYDETSGTHLYTTNANEMVSYKAHRWQEGDVVLCGLKIG